MSEHATDSTTPQRLSGLLQRVVLSALTIVISVNLWTGFPLLALYLGSRVSRGTQVSMGAIGVALLSLCVFTAVGVAALGRISSRYDRIAGRAPGPRQAAPWLRSMRAERATRDQPRRPANAIETIVVVSVVVAVIAFEVWFFFFAGSSLPGGSLIRRSL